MESLERVKAVEAEVAGLVEEARLKSGRELGEFRMEVARRCSLRVSGVLEECSGVLAGARSEAEKNASLVVEGALREAGRLRGSAAGNLDLAVGFVLSRLGV